MTTQHELQAQPTAKPTVYVNIYRDRMGNHFAHETIMTEAEAIVEAEADGERYEYTLTDKGSVDLTPQFSQEWHDQRAADLYDSYIQDARIDSMKSFTMEERA